MSFFIGCNYFERARPRDGLCILSHMFSSLTTPTPRYRIIDIEKGRKIKEQILSELIITKQVMTVNTEVEGEYQSRETMMTVARHQKGCEIQGLRHLKERVGFANRTERNGRKPLERLKCKTQRNINIKFLPVTHNFLQEQSSSVDPPFFIVGFSTVQKCREERWGQKAGEN